MAVEFVNFTLQRLCVNAKYDVMTIPDTVEIVGSNTELQSLDSIKYYFDKFIDKDGNPLVESLDILYAKIVATFCDLQLLANGTIPCTPKIFKYILVDVLMSEEEMQKFAHELNAARLLLFVQCIHKSPILCHRYRTLIDKFNIRELLVNESKNTNDYTSLLCTHSLESLTKICNTDFIRRVSVDSSDEYDVYHLLSVFVRTCETTLLKFIRKQIIPSYHPVRAKKIYKFCTWWLLDE